MGATGCNPFDFKIPGSIRQEDVERISQAVRPVIAFANPLKSCIQGMGCFPNLRNPRVFGWESIGERNPRIFEGADRKKDDELSFPRKTGPFLRI